MSLSSQPIMFKHFFEGDLPFSFDLSRPPWHALTCLDNYFSKLAFSISPEATISPHAELINKSEIHIEAGAVVEGGAQITGPVFIGKNARIAHGACLRARSLIMEGAVVGHCSEVKGSILFPKAKAAHFNYVGDSLVGANVNLGAGVILCNQRLDKKPIAISIEGEKFLTELLKFGACIGDGAALGAGTICNPGTLFEKKGRSLPRSVVTGLISSNKSSAL